MNKRIKELAKQATTVIEATDYSGEGWIFNKEKFAELIVRECADIACKHMELNEGTDFNVGEKIKQHFGVEE